MNYPGPQASSSKPSSTLKRRLSTEMEDPLNSPSSPSSTRLPRQNPTSQQPPARFSVVLGSTPPRPGFQHAATDHRIHQGLEQAKAPKQTPVPLPKNLAMPHLSASPNRISSLSAAPGHSGSTPAPQRLGEVSEPPTLGTMTPAEGGRRGRGRPKGWRPGMSYKKMRGNEPRTVNPGPPGVVKRRGRPPRQPSPPPRELYHRLNAPFIAFLCEWYGCKAELHNLETLRRHVNIVHLNEHDDERYCNWGKCGELDEGREFESLGELKIHMLDAHLEPFAWHVGDGPRNNGGRKTAKGPVGGTPGYLMDKEGNQVTPSVEGQQVEDYITWRDNRRKLKELLLERDRNLPSDESSEAGEEEP